MSEPLAGLADISWSDLRCAYGPADIVPQFLREVASGDQERQTHALAELWGTVWHQGTVYDCTPHVVPFLAALVADEQLRDATRAELALLLGSIASATSFVVGRPPQSFVVAGLRREPGLAPDSELDQVCRQALVRTSRMLETALTTGPPATQAALVAVAAIIGRFLSATARAAITTLSRSNDVRLAYAAQLALALADEQPLSEAQLTSRAAIDDETADYLIHIDDWPIHIRAVEIIRELCDRAVAAHLANGATF